MIALPRTNKVLSKIDLTITFPYWGLLYGGNSSVNDEGTPFNSVFERTLEVTNVINIPKPITIIRIKTPSNEFQNPPSTPTKNMVIIEISIGNLPLHGTKEFVNIAINLSLGESIILQPETPTALQPNPIAIVSACFPQVLHFLNIPSTLNAILGKYPISSKIVNSGKNSAIGGNITETTQANTLYTPWVNASLTKLGICK